MRYRKPCYSCIYFSLLRYRKLSQNSITERLGIIASTFTNVENISSVLHFAEDDLLRISRKLDDEKIFHYTVSNYIHME